MSIFYFPLSIVCITSTFNSILLFTLLFLFSLLLLFSLCATVICTLQYLFYIIYSGILLVLCFGFGFGLDSHSRGEGIINTSSLLTRRLCCSHGERLAFWQWDKIMNLYIKQNKFPIKLFDHSREAAGLWGSHVLNSWRSAELWFQCLHPSLSMNVRYRNTV